MKKIFSILFVLFSMSLQNAYSIESNSFLNEKLELQWKKFENARNYLLEKTKDDSIPIELKKIKREDWESIVSYDDFTKEDLMELKIDQSNRIYKSKVKALRDSTLNLENVRNKKAEWDFCERFPKGGLLHIHPSATIDRTTADDLLRVNNPKINMEPIFNGIDNSDGNKMLYSEERSWLTTLSIGINYLDLPEKQQNKFKSFLFLPIGHQPFSRFNAVFDFFGFVTPDKQSYEKAIFAFVKKAVNEGVIYIEFTASPKPDLLEIIEKVEMETGVTIRINNAFRRTKDLNTLNNDWNLFISRPINKYVTGIDFLDNEEGNPALEKGQFIYGAALYGFLNGKHKLHRTMHSGEIGLVQNPRDSMIMGVERMGHGVNLEKDLIALEYATKIKLPIEINLSSNLRLTDVTSIQKHPFLNYLRLGLPISLSTDDEGIFDTDINNECFLAIKYSDVSYSELKKMSYNSIASSFSPKDIKKNLKIKLDRLFSKFENSKFAKSL